MNDSRGETRFSLFSLAAALGITLAMAVMLGRVVQLQLRPSTELEAHIGPRTSAKTELPLRGDILDRRGRLLCSTRFGERIVIDPTLFPSPPDRAIVQLAEAAGVDPAQIGKPLLAALEINRRIAAGLPLDDAKPFEPVTTASEPAADAPAAAEKPTEPHGPRRYVPVSGVLTDANARGVRALGMSGVMLEKRQIREYSGGEEIASIVGKVGFDHNGLLGTELLLNDQLTGREGKITFVRDAYGQPLWINPGAVRPAVAGGDVRLSVDLELQRIAHEELEKGIEDCDAAGGRLVLLDPATGEIVAMVDLMRDVPGLTEFPWQDAPKPRGKGDPPARPAVAPPGPHRYVTIRPDPGRKTHPALARNRCVEDIYEPGSTFKPFVWSVITEMGLAKTDEVFDTEGGRWRTSYGRSIEDVTKRPVMTWAEVLINSSNIGMIKAGERMTPEQLHGVPVRFGFGKPTHVGLPGEAAGIVTPLSRWTKFSHTSISYGHEISVTPVQMVHAFSAFARDGDAAGTIPSLRLSALPRGDSPTVAYRVLRPDIALLTRQTLRGVTHNVESRWINPPEGGWRYELFGKSGTAEIPIGAPPAGKRRSADGYYSDQYNSSFIAGGPVDHPRLVCIVVIDDPGPERIRHKSHYGSATAGPVVRRVMERALTYLGVPPDPAPAPATLAANR